MKLALEVDFVWDMHNGDIETSASTEKPPSYDRIPPIIRNTHLHVISPDCRARLPFIRHHLEVYKGCILCPLNTTNSSRETQLTWR
jgi:hypothetical protein